MNRKKFFGTGKFDGFAARSVSAQDDRKSKLLLALTPGDPNGIGPEITWKIISEPATWKEKASILCIGAQEPFEKLGVKIIVVNPNNLAVNTRPPIVSEPFVWLVPAPTTPPSRTKISKHPPFSLPGFQSGWSIQTATDLTKKKITAALVTGPISKERLRLGGYPYPGHTELLAALCKRKEVTMMLVNNFLRVSLVTTHIALHRVSTKITRQAILKTVNHTVEYLRAWWNISKPKIAVAALNPHAGEGGLLGHEEIEVAIPTISELKKISRGRYEIIGPLPADTLFAIHQLAKPQDRFDAVVCMYHDQGLIPVKLLDFLHTVNVTLGLPIIRTSVDHGVSFALVGTGRADPSSMRAAIELAIQLASSKSKTP